MSNIKKLMMTAAGGEALNVEDVFSTYLYTGTSSTQTITNGTDLSGEGGLVWIKRRDDTVGHRLYDTERGVHKSLLTPYSNSEQTHADSLTAFNSDGFTLGADTGTNQVNYSGYSYVSWTFRKAPKFFDIVTYTGNGTSGRTISHNLGSVPGCIFIKRTSSAEDWVVYHVGADATAPEEYTFKLNSNFGRIDSTAAFNDTAPTSTNFTVGNNGDVNANGETFVAYLWAHNDGDGEFGPNSDADIIKCGSYTGNATGNGEQLFIDLGFEPQWLMIKRTSTIGDWFLFDNMRGISDGTSGNAELYAQSTAAESESTRKVVLNPTGFTVEQAQTNEGDYIYIAIRRGPMAVPESATDVFSMDMDGTTNNHYTANHVVDFAFYKSKDNAFDWNVNSRLMQGISLKFNKTDAQSGNTLAKFDIQNGWADSSVLTSEYPTWMWGRAPNYFDVVAYTGNGATNHTVSHNLGVAPEMIWIKNRGDSTNWPVYHSGLTSAKMIRLNQNGAEFNMGTIWGNQTFDASGFTVGSTSDETNKANNNYIAYLFASLDGVSKVGSYTGNSSNTQNIDCGFSSGARFVMIKRTDASGNWNIYDTERGIVAGDDSRLELNTTDAEYTISDWVDPLSSGFTVVTFGGGDDDPNINGASYIFYAIA